MGTVISFSGRTAALSLRKSLAAGMSRCLWQVGGSLVEKDASLMIGYCIGASTALRALGDDACAELFDRALAEMHADWRNFEHVMRNLHARLIEFRLEGPAGADSDDER